MPKTNTNKNRNDPRTSKSIRDIKRSMISRIEEEPFDQIQAEQIMKAAPVNKNTFYKYFSSKQDVLDSIREDMLSEMQEQIVLDDVQSVRGGVSLFYTYYNDASPFHRKLLNTEEYGDFAEKLCEEYFASDFFRGFCARPEDFDMVSGFMADVVYGTYTRWHRWPDAGKKPDLETLTDMTARLLEDGLKGLSRDGS